MINVSAYVVCAGHTAVATARSRSRSVTDREHGAPTRDLALVDTRAPVGYPCWVVPALLRLLLPVIAALTLLVAPVTTWAAAGVRGEATCCCPDPKTCECHDHEGKPHPTDELKRCGNADVTIVAPVLTIAITAAPAPVLVAPAAVTIAAETTVAIPDLLPTAPETPPF